MSVLKIVEAAAELGSQEIVEKAAIDRVGVCGVEFGKKNEKIVEGAAFGKACEIGVEPARCKVVEISESKSLEKIRSAAEIVEKIGRTAVVSVAVPGGKAVAVQEMAKEVAKQVGKEVAKATVKEVGGKLIDSTESETLQSLKPHIQSLTEASVQAVQHDIPDVVDAPRKAPVSMDRPEYLGGDFVRSEVVREEAGVKVDCPDRILGYFLGHGDGLWTHSFVNMDGLTKFIPHKDGLWDGEEGNSVWRPDKNSVPGKLNPEGKTWGEILDENGIDGIKFVDGEADFSEVSKGTVKVEGFSTSRDPVYLKDLNGKFVRDADGNKILLDEGNFMRADKALAEQWNAEGREGRTDWTFEDVQDFRRGDNPTGTKYSWHECGDQKTMMLVDQTLHINVPHSGGIAAAKCA